MNQRGFTLTEVAIVGAIIAILTAVAVPDFQEWTAKARLKEDATEMKSHLQFARMLAIQRNTPVTVSFDKATETYDIFIDNGAGVGGVASDFIRNGEEPQLVIASPPQRLNRGVSFHRVNSPTVGTAQGILFNGRGMRRVPLVAPNIVLTAEGIADRYQITVTFVGDVRISEPTGINATAIL